MRLATEQDTISFYNREILWKKLTSERPFKGEMKIALSIEDEDVDVCIEHNIQIRQEKESDPRHVFVYLPRHLAMRHVRLARRVDMHCYMRPWRFEKHFGSTIQGCKLYVVDARIAENGY